MLWKLRRKSYLNDGLRLAMEWGTDWLCATQARMAKRHPFLGQGALDEIDSTCQEVMRFGWAQVVELGPACDDAERRQRFDGALLARYPWIDEENLGRLYSQGMYYAMK